MANANYTGRFYNCKDFENYLLAEGATPDCPEFTTYNKRCRVYSAKELGLWINGEWFYEATHVEQILMEDQGSEFTNLVKANVPVTVIS